MRTQVGVWLCCLCHYGDAPERPCSYACLSGVVSELATRYVIHTTLLGYRVRSGLEFTLHDDDVCGTENYGIGCQHQYRCIEKVLLDLGFGVCVRLSFVVLFCCGEAHCFFQLLYCRRARATGFREDDSFVSLASYGTLLFFSFEGIGNDDGV